MGKGDVLPQHDPVHLVVRAANGSLAVHANCGIELRRIGVSVGGVKEVHAIDANQDVRLELPNQFR